jgi:cellulose synthase/poly-beta-1,6-N-acetylglucosamine synthase-like glycosyltransferase
MIQTFFHLLSAAIVVLYLVIFILSTDVRKREEPSGVVRVLVPTYNEADNIGSCLESLTSMEGKGIEHTIHVIDDNSPDGTADVVRSSFPGAGLIQRERRTSKADALNSAVKDLEGDTFAVVDADCVVSGDWLGGIIEPLSEDEHGVSSGSILVRNRRESIWARVQSCELAFLCHQLMRPVERVGMLYSINGNNFAFTRECWERVGGFDPSKLTEDNDFAVKTRLAGLQIGFARAKVFTRVPSGLGELLRQRRRWYLGWYQNLSSASLFAGALFILLFFYAFVFFVAAFSIYTVAMAAIYYLELLVTYRKAYGSIDPLSPLLFIVLSPFLSTAIILTALPSALRGKDQLDFKKHW